MKPYLCLMFCKQEELRTFAKEVAEVLQRVAGSNIKRAESAAGVTAVAFISSWPSDRLHSAFWDLWRREQRVWVLPLSSRQGSNLMIDLAIMEWVRKHCPEEVAA
jgi:hypothetical protein